MLPTIFCPKCNALILDRPACPACGWRRPPAGGDVGEVAWVADLGTRLIKPYCYPVVAAGAYCLGTEDGMLLALDLGSGQVIWERRLGPGAMAHGLASDGERLFVGCEDIRPIPSGQRSLLALDATSGDELWHCPTGGHSLSAAAESEGNVYLTSSDGQIHAVEAATGRRCWSAEHPAWSPAAPAAAEGLVCAGGRAGTLVAYEAASGSERWQFSAEGWLAVRPRIAGGAVYVTCWEGHLYALDANSGDRRWMIRAPRSRGFTTPPLVIGERVFAGCRVYRELGGERQPAYALLALDAATGKEVWRAYTARHIYTPPAAAGDTVLFGSADGMLYAVDAARGEECWRREVKSRPVAEPRVSGDLAYFGGRDGLVHAVRWQCPPPLLDLDPEFLRAEERYAEAAVVYALRGALEEAAALYDASLDLPREAAVLYEQAGKPGEAAALWARAGDLLHARQAYRQAGDQRGLAGILLRMGEPLEAARVYEEIGELEAAAGLYERAGDRSRAAELYLKLKLTSKAIDIFESLGRWEQKVKVLVNQGDLAEAARILEEHGQRERAADLFEQARELGEALRLRTELQHWDRVAGLSAQVGDAERQAQAHEQLGQTQLAAQAYEQAAQQVAAASPVDEARAAALYERAAALFGDLYEDERSAACRRQVIRYRHLPEIVVQGSAENAFVEHEWNTLKLQVSNNGHGLAGNIRIGFQGPFEVKGETCIRGLRPNRQAMLEVFVCSHKGQVGPKVPLEITVTYEDRQRAQHELVQRIPVPVVKPGLGLAGEQATPVQIIVRELYQAGARKDVGDRVHIERTGGRGLAVEEVSSAGLAPVRRTAAQVNRCPRCNLPVEEADHRYCPDCGTPLRPLMEDADEPRGH